MCRMLGMTATRPTSVRELLSEGGRCLKALSNEHADGWGLALRTANDWNIHRSTACAARCPNFASGELETTIAIAHVRKRTVGELALVNTHPFRRDRFVLAHNGTVETSALIARTAPEQAAQIEGTTDSERLFAFILTHVDAAGEVEQGIRAAVRALHALGDIGPSTFLFSDGARLFAHRFGRELFVTQRVGVAVIASEPLDDSEHWELLAEREVFVVEPPAISRAA